MGMFISFFSSRRRHTILQGDWSSDVCYSDLVDRHDRRRMILGVEHVQAVGQRERLVGDPAGLGRRRGSEARDRKSTRLNSSHLVISYAVFCLKKKKKHE